MPTTDPTPPGAAGAAPSVAGATTHPVRAGDVHAAGDMHVAAYGVPGGHEPDSEPPPPARRGRAQVAGGAVALFVVLTVVAVCVAGPRQERRLEHRGLEALAAAGYNGVAVDADGFDLRATGARSDVEAAGIAAVLAAVRGARSISVVDPADAAGVAHSDPAVPLVVATLSSGRLELRGQVPSRALENELLAAAERSVGPIHTIDLIRAAEATASAVAAADVAATAELVARLPTDLVAGSVTLDSERTLTVAGLPRVSTGSGPLLAALTDLRARAPGLRIRHALHDAEAAR